MKATMLLLSYSGDLEISFNRTSRRLGLVLFCHGMLLLLSSLVSTFSQKNKTYKMGLGVCVCVCVCVSVYVCVCVCL